MVKKLIITADDLGLTPEINKGIYKAHRAGLVTCAALLVNAPATDQGIEIARELKTLETGLHLSLVESISLRKIKSTVTDEIDYFKGNICLIRHWKEFTKKFYLGKIINEELEEELELQFQLFLKSFGNIPFLNGTQHLHILPGVWDIILKLSLKYQVKAIRLPALSMPNATWLNTKSLFLLPFQLFGEIARRDLKGTNIKVASNVFGMQYSGKIDERKFLNLIHYAPFNASEIVMHPGYECSQLRQNLPWSYKSFNWEMERKTLTSPVIADYITKNRIQLITYSNL
jgi:chitin disaccharide deacetylase